jgi:hypothetical protein
VVAKQEKTIAYSNLAAQIHAILPEAHDIRLDTLLGEISEYEDAAGRGMLSVVVVHKEGDQRPGDGFFGLAEELGYAVGDRDEFWITILTRVYTYWRST